MRLVSFDRFSSELPVLVNPDLVRFIEPNPDDRDDNSTRIVMEGVTVVVQGEVTEVADELCGRRPLPDPKPIESLHGC